MQTGFVPQKLRRHRLFFPPKAHRRSATLDTGFSNLQLATVPWHHLLVMPYFPQTQTKTRSPRVRVPNSESIRFNLGGRQVSAVLQKISLTGGLAEFTSSIGSATIAEARLNTISGQVNGLVEFLPSPDGTATYPFRFIALSDEDYERLSSTIKVMQQQGFGA